MALARSGVKRTVKPPEFVKPLQNSTLREGENVTLECYVRGCPAPEVKWEKDGVGIVTTRQLKTEREGERCRLFIKSCTCNETGHFACIATNKAGAATTNATVTLCDDAKQLIPKKALPVKDQKSAVPNQKTTPKLKTKKEGTPPRIPRQKNGSNKSQAIAPLTKRQTVVRKRPRPPEILMPPTNKVIDEGDGVKFMCSATPDLDVQWTKDNEVVVESEDVYIHKEDAVYILELREVSLNDAGNYTVRLSNSAGTVCATALLEVRGKEPKKTPPQVIRKLSDISVENGTNFCLSCEVSGNPVPTITWFQDCEQLVPNGCCRQMFDGLTACLVIEKATKDSHGSYTCCSKNEIGETETSCTVSIIESQETLIELTENGQKPIFLTRLQNATVLDGDTVTFSVQVKGTKPMEIVWVRNDSEIKNSPDFRYVASPDGSIHSLVIADVFLEDSGLYTCEAYNLYGDAETSCQMFVKERPPDNSQPSVQTIPTIIVEEDEILEQNVVQNKENYTRRSQSQSSEQSRNGTKLNECSQSSFVEEEQRHVESAVSCVPSNIEASNEEQQRTLPRLTPAQILKGPQSIAILRGETITLRAHFIGSPFPNVTWIKGGKVLKEDRKTTILKQEGLIVLTVKNSTSDDSGKYVITVENSGGSDCHFASVSVEGTPDPPAGKPVTSDSTSHSVVICWSGSPYDGGSVITGYVVEMRSLSDPRWVRVSRSCHSTSYVARDLLPDRQYIFRVKAENIHGLSEPSLESDPVMIRDTQGEEISTIEYRTVEVENDDFETKYELKDEIGKGKFGIVYICEEIRTGEIRAAKVIRCVKTKDKKNVRDEVDIMNQLRHPKLLQLLAAFQSSKEIILVMEYISGGELFERIVAEDALTERDCIMFMRQICDGVQYMHSQNIMHLDLKPENILCQSKTSNQIKIIDFGLARKYDGSGAQRVLVGTPEFVAPEVISYDPISPASDMWSVGVVCYVLLSGLSPFMGETNAETFVNVTRVSFDFEDDVFDAVSSEAKNLISNLLVKRPEKRLSASECLEHKWLSKDRGRLSLTKLSTTKLKKFVVHRKWQKTGNAIMALGRMAVLSGFSNFRYPLTSSSSTSGSENSRTTFQKSDIVHEKAENGDGSGESGVGDTDSVDSSISERHSGDQNIFKWDPKTASPNENAPYFSRSLKREIQVDEKDGATLRVKVVGTPVVSWYKDGTFVCKSNCDEDGLCTFALENCSAEDQAEYVCSASNSAGEVTCYCQVYVIDKKPNFI